VGGAVAKDSLSIEQALALLAATPERIAASTAGLTEGQLHAAPSPGEWSANEVLAHLRACADARGNCIPAILAEDRPTFRAINPLVLLKKTNYLELDFQPSFEAFARQRAELLAILEALPPEGRARSATVTGAGTPIERTVLIYADWVARHERPHVKQIEAIAAALRS
jgi:hypothetical protein